MVDASVAIKWFVPEVHSQAATRLLRQATQFIAPDLIFAEVGNILWKKQRRQEISEQVAFAILNDFKRYPIHNYQASPLLNDAWHIALNYQCTVYDSLYVALALREKSQLVTADRSLINKLNQAPWRGSLLWVEDC